MYISPLVKPNSGCPNHNIFSSLSISFWNKICVDGVIPETKKASEKKNVSGCIKTNLISTIG